VNPAKRWRAVAGSSARVSLTHPPSAHQPSPTSLTQRVFTAALRAPKPAMAKMTKSPAPAPTRGRSGSSASGSDMDDDDDDEPVFNLSEQDRINILNMHPDLKPSQLPTIKQPGKGPLVILSPDELHRLAAEGQTSEVVNEEEYEVVEEELWEEVVNCVLWSIPFYFLFYCM